MRERNCVVMWCLWGKRRSRLAWLLTQKLNVKYRSCREYDGGSPDMLRLVPTLIVGAPVERRLSPATQVQRRPTGGDTTTFHALATDYVDEALPEKLGGGALDEEHNETNNGSNGDRPISGGEA